MPADRLPRPRPRPYRARATVRAGVNAPAVDRPDAGRPATGRPGAEVWLDEDAGPVVRPYVMTGGRVDAPGVGFDLVAFVVAVGPDGARAGSADAAAQPEHRAILALVGRPLSVAEISAHLDLPLGVVRVLLADLLAGGLITVHEPPPPDELPDERLLEAVLDGLRAL